VIVIAGAKYSQRGKFYAGISRAAYKTDAVVIDSGVRTGIEPFAIRKGKHISFSSTAILILLDVKLIGVCPEKFIKFPKINTTQIGEFELTRGHTHLFLVNQEEKKEEE